jgi:transposase
MMQLTPQSRIFVATQPVDFRKGIDGLCAVCRHALGDNPLEGAVYPPFRILSSHYSYA